MIAGRRHVGQFLDDVVHGEPEVVGLGKARGPQHRRAGIDEGHHAAAAARGDGLFDPGQGADDDHAGSSPLGSAASRA